ncbi:MAG: hypothetical protein WD208_11795 [Dehalococcoidia bacterium]
MVRQFSGNVAGSKILALFVLALVTVAVATGVGAAFLTGGQPETGGDHSIELFLPGLRPPAPATMEEFVRAPGAIVIGQVGRILETRFEGPFDTATGEFPVFASEPDGLPVTYFELEIDQILKDDGVIGESRLLRLGGVPGGDLHPEVGDRLLFSLGRNSDGTSYGIVGEWSMIHMDEDMVKTFTGGTLNFAQDTHPDEFVQEVRSAINS